MSVYIIMLLVSVWFGGQASSAKKTSSWKEYRILAVLSAIPFIGVTVFRYRVGTDWTYVYEPYLYYIKHGIEEFAEKGFTLIYKIIGLFTDDSWWVIAFVGLLTIIFFFLAIYQQSCMIPFSILLFFITNKYFTSLNQIRQMLAMSLFIYSLKYIYQRNWKMYFFLNLIGNSIHTSSMMYLPLYFLYGKKIDARGNIILLVASVVSFPVLRVLLPKIVGLTRFGWYLDSQYVQNNFYLIGFCVTLLFTLLHIWYLSRFPDGDMKYQFMTVMMSLSTIMLLYSAVIPQILRISEGLSVVQIFSFAEILKKEKEDKIWGFVWILIVGIYTIKLLYDVYVNGWYGALPYQTIFSR